MMALTFGLYQGGYNYWESSGLSSNHRVKYLLFAMQNIVCLLLVTFLSQSPVFSEIGQI